MQVVVGPGAVTVAYEVIVSVPDACTTVTTAVTVRSTVTGLGIVCVTVTASVAVAVGIGSPRKRLVA